MRQVALTLGALLATAALLSACSSDPGTGPLGAGGAVGGQCVPAALGQTRTMGIYVLQNPINSPAVTIQSISLRSPHGVRVTGGFWAVPLLPNTPMIGTAVWPPTALPGDQRAWALRERAVGAVIKPGQKMSLVFGLTRTAPGIGGSPGPRIIYTAGGKSYVWWSNWVFAIAAKCPNPSPSAY